MFIYYIMRLVWHLIFNMLVNDKDFNLTAALSSATLEDTEPTVTAAASDATNGILGPVIKIKDLSLETT